MKVTIELPDDATLNDLVKTLDGFGYEVSVKLTHRFNSVEDAERKIAEDSDREILRLAKSGRIKVPVKRFTCRYCSQVGRDGPKCQHCLGKRWRSRIVRTKGKKS